MMMMVMAVAVVVVAEHVTLSLGDGDASSYTEASPQTEAHAETLGKNRGESVKEHIWEEGVG